MGDSDPENNIGIQYKHLLILKIEGFCRESNRKYTQLGQFRPGIAAFSSDRKIGSEEQFDDGIGFFPFLVVYQEGL